MKKLGREIALDEFKLIKNKKNKNSLLTRAYITSKMMNFCKLKKNVQFLFNS